MNRFCNGQYKCRCSNSSEDRIYKPEPVILHRGMGGEELKVAQSHFKCVSLRSRVPPGSLVIGRYSVLPFYKELEQELADYGSKLINNFSQHNYVSDLGNWVEDLDGLTPRTWNRLEDVPEDGGPFVVKGATNSKKFSRQTHMFARNKREAVDTACRLMDDGLICNQHIYVREYIPLIKLIDGLQGMPVTEEYRFFTLGGKILSRGYYWSNYEDDIPGGPPDPSNVPEEFMLEVLRRIHNKVNFVVVDVARTQSGRWIVIELNDGQMSGLSMNKPEVLYNELYKLVHSDFSDSIS